MDEGTKRVITFGQCISIEDAAKIAERFGQGRIAYVVGVAPGRGGPLRGSARVKFPGGSITASIPLSHGGTEPVDGGQGAGSHVYAAMAQPPEEMLGILVTETDVDEDG